MRSPTPATCLLLLSVFASGGLVDGEDVQPSTPRLSRDDMAYDLDSSSVPPMESDTIANVTTNSTSPPLTEPPNIATILSSISRDVQPTGARRDLIGDRYAREPEEASALPFADDPENAVEVGEENETRENEEESSVMNQYPSTMINDQEEVITEFIDNFSSSEGLIYSPMNNSTSINGTSKDLAVNVTPRVEDGPYTTLSSPLRMNEERSIELEHASTESPTTVENSVRADSPTKVPEVVQEVTEKLVESIVKEGVETDESKLVQLMDRALIEATSKDNEDEPIYSDEIPVIGENKGSFKNLFLDETEESGNGELTLVPPMDRVLTKTTSRSNENRSKGLHKIPTIKKNAGSINNSISNKTEGNLEGTGSGELTLAQPKKQISSGITSKSNEDEPKNISEIPTIQENAEFVKNSFVNKPEVELNDNVDIQANTRQTNTDGRGENWSTVLKSMIPSREERAEFNDKILETVRSAVSNAIANQHVTHNVPIAPFRNPVALTMMPGYRTSRYWYPPQIQMPLPPAEVPSEPNAIRKYLARRFAYVKPIPPMFEPRVDAQLTPTARNWIRGLPIVDPVVRVEGRITIHEEPRRGERVRECRLIPTPPEPAVCSRTEPVCRRSRDGYGTYVCIPGRIACAARPFRARRTARLVCKWIWKPSAWSRWIAHPKGIYISDREESYRTATMPQSGALPPWRIKVPRENEWVPSEFEKLEENERAEDDRYFEEQSYPRELVEIGENERTIVDHSDGPYRLDPSNPSEVSEQMFEEAIREAIWDEPEILFDDPSDERDSVSWIVASRAPPGAAIEAPSPSQAIQRRRQQQPILSAKENNGASANSNTNGSANVNYNRDLNERAISAAKPADSVTSIRDEKAERVPAAADKTALENGSRDSKEDINGSNDANLNANIGEHSNIDGGPSIISTLKEPEPMHLSGATKSPVRSIDSGISANFNADANRNVDLNVNRDFDRVRKFESDYGQQVGMPVAEGKETETMLTFEIGSTLSPVGTTESLEKIDSQTIKVSPTIVASVMQALESVDSDIDINVNGKNTNQQVSKINVELPHIESIEIPVIDPQNVPPPAGRSNKNLNNTSNVNSSRNMNGNFDQNVPTNIREPTEVSEAVSKIPTPIFEVPVRPEVVLSPTIDINSHKDINKNSIANVNMNRHSNRDINLKNEIIPTIDKLKTTSQNRLTTPASPITSLPTVASIFESNRITIGENVSDDVHANVTSDVDQKETVPTVNPALQAAKPVEPQPVVVSKWTESPRLISVQAEVINNSHATTNDNAKADTNRNGSAGSSGDAGGVDVNDMIPLSREPEMSSRPNDRESATDSELQSVSADSNMNSNIISNGNYNSHIDVGSVGDQRPRIPLDTTSAPIQTSVVIPSIVRNVEPDGIVIPPADNYRMVQNLKSTFAPAITQSRERNTGINVNHNSNLNIGHNADIIQNTNLAAQWAAIVPSIVRNIEPVKNIALHVDNYKIIDQASIFTPDIPQASDNINFKEQRNTNINVNRNSNLSIDHNTDMNQNTNLASPSMIRKPMEILSVVPLFPAEPVSIARKMQSADASMSENATVNVNQNSNLDINHTADFNAHLNGNDNNSRQKAMLEPAVQPIIPSYLQEAIPHLPNFETPKHNDANVNANHSTNVNINRNTYSNENSNIAINEAPLPAYQAPYAFPVLVPAVIPPRFVPMPEMTGSAEANANQNANRNGNLNINHNANTQENQQRPVAPLIPEFTSQLQPVQNQIPQIIESANPSINQNGDVNANHKANHNANNYQNINEKSLGPVDDISTSSIPIARDPAMPKVIQPLSVEQGARNVEKSSNANYNSNMNYNSNFNSNSNFNRNVSAGSLKDVSLGQGIGIGVGATGHLVSDVRAVVPISSLTAPLTDSSVNHPPQSGTNPLLNAGLSRANPTSSIFVDRNARQNSNADYSSKVNYNANYDANYSAEYNHNAKVNTHIPTRTVENTKHKKGWYALWYNSGEDENDWTEIWNNKKFKRFLEQQLQDMKDKEVVQTEA